MSRDDEAGLKSGKTEEQEGEEGESAPTDEKDYSPAKLLADAKELAGKDKDLLKRVKSLENA